MREEPISFAPDKHLTPYRRLLLLLFFSSVYYLHKQTSKHVYYLSYWHSSVKCTPRARTTKSQNDDVRKHAERHTLLLYCTPCAKRARVPRAVAGIRNVVAYSAGGTTKGRIIHIIPSGRGRAQIRVEIENTRPGRVVCSPVITYTHHIAIRRAHRLCTWAHTWWYNMRL